MTGTRLLLFHTITQVPEGKKGLMPKDIYLP